MNYILQLYIAGETPLSNQAINNLHTIKEQYLTEQDSIEIINVELSPQVAFEKKIIITPTLIKQQPLPALRIIGNLSDIESVAMQLGLK